MYGLHFDIHLYTGWYYLLVLNSSLLYENEYRKTFDVQRAKDISTITEISWGRFSVKMYILTPVHLFVLSITLHPTRHTSVATHKQTCRYDAFLLLEYNKASLVN
jgi:hypothetical protein